MMSEREQIQQETYDTVNMYEEASFELTPQEEIDMNDCPSHMYNYKDPNHKPPFKNGEDYTEIEASQIGEVNAVAFGKGGYYLKKITEKHGIAYLFHNRETDRIEIWGESNKFDSVILDILKRFENAEAFLKDKYI